MALPIWASGSPGQCSSTVRWPAGYALRRRRVRLAGNLLVATSTVGVVAAVLGLDAPYVPYAFVLPVIFASVLLTPATLVLLSLADAAFVVGAALPQLGGEGVMLGEIAGAKEIMVRRGVFRNRRMRMEVKPLDEYDLAEIDRIWERIEPHLLWHKA
jgi:hypothetical protein